MNRNTFYLLVILGAVLSVFSFKFYLQEKKQAVQESIELSKFKQKVNQIVYLQNRYRFKPLKLKFCKTNDRGDKIDIECTRLDKNRFRTVQNYVFKSNYKINKYSIIKDKNLSTVKAEIMK